MPFPNFHACRIRQPGEFQKDSMRTVTNGGVNVIVGRLKGKTTTTTQALRYPKSTWSAEKARKHCADKGGSFEAAAKTASEIYIEWNLAEKTKEYLVIPRGEFDHPGYGHIIFEDEFFDELIKNYNDEVLGETKPFVDQDHDMRGAAGWFVGLHKAEDGLFGEIDWTDVGRDLIKRKIYRYFSPSYSSYDDPETGKRYKYVFRGGALTNTPFLKRLPEITLEETSQIIKLSEGEETIMDILDDLKKKFGIEEEDEGKAFDAIIVKIDELQKLAEDKPQDEALKKEVADLKAKLESAKTTKVNATETEAQLKEATGTIKTLSEKITVMERDTCIKKALKEGRMLPEKKEFYEKQWMENPDFTKQFVEALEPVVNTTQKSRSSASGENKQELRELSDNEQQVHNALGHSEEDIKKFGGEEAK